MLYEVITASSAGQAQHDTGKDSATAKLCAEPLRRYAPLAALPAVGQADTQYLTPLQLDPSATGICLQPGSVLAVCALDTHILPRLLSGIAPLGCVLGVPQQLIEQCAPLVSRITSYNVCYTKLLRLN